MKIKTYSPKLDDIQREWFVVDAQGKTLGRLASEIARLLHGKHKPIYATHMDTGDFVIVVNADKIRVTGRKLEQKRYYRHSGYPGGLKSRTLREMLDQYPERVIRIAVQGMLPKNRLGRQMIKKLKVYAGATHPHQAQQPKVYEL
jgi:large subunit ribosomal protein L13